MLLFPSLAIAQHLLVASVQGDYDLTLRSEVRAQSYTQANATSAVLGEMELVPRAMVLLRDGELGLTAAYFPRLFFPDVTSTVSPWVLHQAQLMGERRLGLDRRIYAGEQASYG